MTGGALRLLELTLQPLTPADRSRLEQGLDQIVREDPMLTAEIDPLFGDAVIAGVSDRHLEIAIDRLKRQFDVRAIVGVPHVVLKEALIEEGTQVRRIVLEPIMCVAISTPEEYATSVIENLKSRRGRVDVHDEDEGKDWVSVIALVPLAELFAYAGDLRQRTLGRAAYTLHFACYEPVRPPGDEGDRTSFVGAPLEPSPGRRDASIALPEPDDEAPLL